MFDGEIVLADFYADWCGPCQMMKPVVAEFAAAHPEVKVVPVNIDEYEELADEYRASTIPCFVLMHNGAEVAREVGVISPKKLAKMVEKNNG